MFDTVVKQVIFLFTNPILLACISSWFCAQFVKTVIAVLYGRIRSLTELLESLIWKTGGMPSSHSALVSSLATVIAFRNGIDSDIFVLTFCFFMITIRDALGVRRSSGIQARKINEIGKSLTDKEILEYKAIKEVNGHTPMEVTIGCFLGFFIGVAYSVF